MKTLEELKKQLERAKERQRKLFKEKAASPKEIMAKAAVCAEEIQAIEQEIREYANK
jgi:hypothetical protein